MTDPTILIEAVAVLLREDPDLQLLAPNWSAEDVRGRVFAGTPVLTATNTGRAPYVVITVADLDRTTTHDSGRLDAIATVTLSLRLVARGCVSALTAMVVAALSTSANRTLNDAAHVLGTAIQRKAVEAIGPCEATELLLAVRLIEQPGVWTHAT